MKLPNKHSVAGRVLRLMLDGKPRTKIEITDALELHPAKEVTARLRDYRKPVLDGGLGMTITCSHSQLNGQRFDVYRVAKTPRWALEAVADEDLEREAVV